jgi:hypothetical protein
MLLSKDLQVIDISYLTILRNEYMILSHFERAEHEYLYAGKRVKLFEFRQSGTSF